MKTKIYTIDCRTRKEKFEDFKYNFKKKAKKVAKWSFNNMDKIIMLTPFVIGCSRVIIKNIQINKVKKVKEFYCYDRSLGHYWELKRKLKNEEWLEIDRRKQQGERLSDILESLKVLK